MKRHIIDVPRSSESARPARYLGLDKKMAAGGARRAFERLRRRPVKDDAGGRLRAYLAIERFA